LCIACTAIGIYGGSGQVLNGVQSGR